MYLHMYCTFAMHLNIVVLTVHTAENLYHFHWSLNRYFSIRFIFTYMCVCFVVVVVVLLLFLFFVLFCFFA